MKFGCVDVGKRKHKSDDVANEKEEKVGPKEKRKQIALWPPMDRGNQGSVGRKRKSSNTPQNNNNNNNKQQ